jgi:hypothetical protein
MKRVGKKKSVLLLCMIMVLSLVTMPITILGEEVLTETEIEFTGSSYNEETDTSVWNYKVTSGEQPSLSHWNLATCEEHTIVSVSDKWIETTESVDGSTGFLGLKFEQSLDANETIDVWLELEGNWETGLIKAVTRSGLGFEEIQVEGPTCVETEETGEDGSTIDEDTAVDDDPESSPVSEQEAAIELDVAASLTVIPEDAQILKETDKLIVYLSADEELLIHAIAESENEISGSWEFNVGGQLYTVKEGMNDVIIMIEEPPVGTYQVSAKFSAATGNETAEEVVTVSVPTQTGGELPETATPYYNVLLLGALLAIVGALTMLRIKRYQ